jgi:hypothetical protein
MIGYLPELYPDELVYSWLSRYLVHSGHRLHSVVLKEFFCKRSDNPSKEYLGNLNDEAKKFIQEVIPLRDLILLHTMTRCARFLPLVEKKEAMHRMEFEYCDPHFLFPILIRSEEDAWIRYCPACAQEDRDTYGETYWHRKHQLRGIRVCHKHGCWLERSAVSAKSEHDYRLSPAEECVVIDTPRYCDNPELLRYTRFITDVFDAPMDFTTDIPFEAVLHSALLGTKYMKSSGKTRYTQQLADDLYTFYEKIGITNITSMSQIQKALLLGKADFTVVCQIAFFLGITVEELTSPKLTPEQIAVEQEAHHVRGRVCPDWEEFDTAAAPILEQLAHDIYTGAARPDGRPERVSERLIYRTFELDGERLHWYRLQNAPKCQAIMQKYYETYEDHWCRRLVWAYEKLKSERGGKPLYWVDLRKVSGVKERNLHKVIPLLHKYTDPKTAKAIRQIIE